jgi:peptidoglycan hydrolase CwlO-like protein
MQEIIQLIRRKNQLLYDMNCVRRYIESGDFDHNLKNAWDNLNTELEEVERALDSLRKPQLEELEKRRLELCEKAERYEKELCGIRQEIKEIDKLIINMK